MKVSMRGGFSDRNAIKAENVAMQLKKFDSRTRNKLQNAIGGLYANIYAEDTYYTNVNIQNFFRFVLSEIYSVTVDPLKYYHDEKTLGIINNTIQNDDYDDVLTLIEGIVQYWDTYLRKTDNWHYYNEHSGYVVPSVYEIMNSVFEREYIGYRFIDGIISPICDEYELEAIKTALENKYQPIYDHLSKANSLLSDRDNPDYENSIKDSISAVEAICTILTGLSGGEATLGKMLKKLDHDGIKVHGGLASAFSILYGYTSDANGIRHAGNIGGPASTFEEAKFMLVSCSAFINYLLALYAD